MEETLNPDEGFEVDCADIQILLQGTLPEGQVAVPAIGFVVITSPKELDVVGVYTAMIPGVVTVVAGTGTGIALSNAIAPSHVDGQASANKNSSPASPSYWGRLLALFGKR